MELKSSASQELHTRQINTISSGTLEIKPNKWHGVKEVKEFEHDFTEIVRVTKHFGEDKYLVYGMRSHQDEGKKEATVDAEIYEFAVVAEAVLNIVARVAEYCGIVLSQPPSYWVV